MTKGQTLEHNASLDFFFFIVIIISPLHFIIVIHDIVTCFGTSYYSFSFACSKTDKARPAGNFMGS